MLANIAIQQDVSPQTTFDWRWEVQIRGALSDMEHLARHFTSAHASVFRDERGDSYLYHSDAFEACETSEEVLETADDNLAVLSGILKFVRDSHETVLTGAVHKRHADGRRDVFVHRTRKAAQPGDFKR